MDTYTSIINNSSAVAPRGLKKLTMKLRATLEEAKCKVHKKKASANTGEALIMESIVMKPKRAADQGIAPAIKTTAAKEEVLALTAETQPLEDQDQFITIRPKVTEADDQAVGSKQQDQDIAIQPVVSEGNGQAIPASPNHTNEQGQNIIMNLKPAEESRKKVNSPGNRQKSSKKEKAEKRAARKEARKAKWAARRAAFKHKAHKVGEALFIPVAVVCGIVFGPVILAFDVCLCAFKAVVWLVVKIFDCLSAPFVACFYFCR